jgi:hypothetical protein
MVSSLSHTAFLIRSCTTGAAAQRTVAEIEADHAQSVPAWELLVACRRPNPLM